MVLSVAVVVVLILTQLELQVGQVEVEVLQVADPQTLLAQAQLDKEALVEQVVQAITLPPVTT